MPDHREHRPPRQRVPAGDGLRAVRADRRRGQAAVPLRRPRPRRRARAAHGASSTEFFAQHLWAGGEPAMSRRPAISTSTGRRRSTRWRAIPPAPRSTRSRSGAPPFATLYGVRLTSLGPYRLFGYLSVPAGRRARSRRSTTRRSTRACWRSFRRARRTCSAAATSPSRWRAAGSATPTRPTPRCSPASSPTGIDRAASYVFRGIVADSVRGLEFLLTRRELDPARVVVVGNDLALITAALRPGATHVVTAPALFYNTAALAPKTQRVSARGDQRLPARLFPARADAVRRTLAYYDLARLRSSRRRHHPAHGGRARRGARRARPSSRW